MLVFLFVFSSLSLLCLVWLLLQRQPFHDPSTIAAAAASSSSISPPNCGSNRRYLYKVFLSFRGEDTRNNFVSHLYKELTQKGIHTFKDDHDLKRGDSLTPSLLEAISGSRVAVIVLSEHYASSTWCLKELVEIMECRKRNGQQVVPIFYKVDPSDVKNQRGSFGEDLKKHEKKRKLEKDYEAEMKKWRNALTQVATIAGWDSCDRDEASFIEHIVRDISDKLACATSSDACDLVAIGSQIAEIDKLLEVEREVHMLGIWGMGGIGKTTLAKVLYNRMSLQYQARCFLGNVKDKFGKLGAPGLQKELLSKVLKERDLDTWSLDEDSGMIKDRLCCKKVLIVLDDVDNIEQLEVLAKNSNWFGFGSTIIITTQDKRLLHQNEVDDVYEVKCLKHDEALQLFSRHAFKQNQIKKDYCGLAVDFVNYAKGFPLALRVLGRFLRDRPIEFWEEELQRLGSTPNQCISDVLEVSFNGLEVNEKDVFLDVACFHNWTYKNEASRILNGCGLFPNRAFPILIEKSLISIEHNKVGMHDLLQDMGRNIVQRESNKLGERSRLWDSKDICHVLTKKKGTEMIKGVSLNLHGVQGTINLEEDAFVGMDRLRFLKISDLEHKLHIPDKMHCGLKLYTDELAYLNWRGCLPKSLSLGFCVQNLVEHLSDSNFKTLWKGAQEFFNLKILNLQGSEYLVEIPDLSKARNIKQIYLENCERLVEVHSSIQYLDKLELLNLEGCEYLKILPSRLDSSVLKSLDLSECYKVEKCPELPPCLQKLILKETSVKELPSSVENLSSLSLLNLEGSENFSQLPDYLGNLKSLAFLYLGKTAITELPSSTKFLSSLTTVHMRDCKYLFRLPNCLGNLESLQLLALDETAITELPHSIENLTLLESLDLSNCEKLESLPTNLYRLSSLSSLHMDHCKRLRSIPNLPPLLSKLGATHCESLENFSDNSKGGIQRGCFCCFDFRECFKLSEKARNNIFSFALSTFLIDSAKDVPFFLSGSEIPPWICNQAVGSLINVKTSSNFATIRSVLCCLVFKGEGNLSLLRFCRLRYRCQLKGDNRNQGHIEDQSNNLYVKFIGSSDQTMLYNFGKPVALDSVVGDELSFEFFLEGMLYRNQIKVNKCGISFLVDEEHD